MDQRVEAFLADVLALEGETSDAIRQAVRAGLADCEAVFRTQESNRRMKDRGRTHAIRYAALAWPRKCGDGREHRRRSTYNWSSVSSTGRNSLREISR